MTLPGFWWSLALIAILGSMVLVTNSNTSTCGVQTSDNKTVLSGDCKKLVTVGTNRQELVLDFVSLATGTDSIDEKFDLMLGKCSIPMKFKYSTGDSILYVDANSLDLPVHAQVNGQDITFVDSTGDTTLVNCDTTKSIFTAGSGDKLEVAVQIKPQKPGLKGIGKLKLTIDAPLAQKQEEPSKWTTGVIVGIVVVVVVLCLSFSSSIGSSVFFGYKHRHARVAEAQKGRLPQSVVHPSVTNRAAPSQTQTKAITVVNTDQVPTVAAKKELSANSIMAQIKAGFIKDPEVSMQERAARKEQEKKQAEENAQKSFHLCVLSLRCEKKNSTPRPKLADEITAKSNSSEDEEPRNKSQEKSADKPRENTPEEHTAEDYPDEPAEKPVEKQTGEKEVSNHLKQKKELYKQEGFFEQEDPYSTKKKSLDEMNTKERDLLTTRDSETTQQSTDVTQRSLSQDHVKTKK
ncbi:hypothetical protein M3Y98_00774700 [Aphelenchoides besseyi]|nr:hypothetical protein M3Y98_00774700 [Aphelenchoides besseyi]